MAPWPAALEDTFLHIRYEDLLSDFVGQMLRLEEHLEIPTDAAEAEDLRERFSFANLTRRAAGQERKDAHLRKGVAGDWANHFDDEISAAFDAAYGDFARKLGYV